MKGGGSDRREAGCWAGEKGLLGWRPRVDAFLFWEVITVRIELGACGLLTISALTRV